MTGVNDEGGGGTLLPPTGSPPTAAGQPDGIAHRDFLERALVAAGEWTRYADPKALGVLVLLGIGIKDLIDHANRFVHPHEPAGVMCGVLSAHGHSCGGIAGTTLFFIAGALAALVVGFVTHALFSRLSVRGLLGLEHDETLPRSRFFFGEVSRYGSQEAYAQAVLAKKDHELLRDLAGQVYEVSRICQIKHVATQRAYAATLLFLAAWVGGRIVLSTIA